ncbi:MAG: hypothetical protein ACK4NR_11080 [Micavibrio sp.]
MAGDKKQKNKKKSKSWSSQILLVFALLTMVIFMPTTILLLFGMLPTVVAAVVDRKGGTRAITVGSMNLAGCIPFLLDLWTSGHTAANAVALITNPSTIVVMYAAAAIGYMIDWALSGIIATIMIQRTTARLEAIRKRQDELIERWGPEVTGDIPVDPDGFPLEEAEAKGAV